jgi:uncharacterized protein YutE (UPF0331/DUF86 family)
MGQKSMPVVEYIQIVEKSGSFCNSVDSFVRLLKVDSDIAIEGDQIKHRNDFACKYALTTGEIAAKQQRYFHLRFEIVDETLNAFERFSEFLKAIRTILNRLGGQPETLWDDISFFYSLRGYEIIHRIESLMRKLIANFMLVTIGKEWITEATPSEVKETIKKRGGDNHLNALHKTDFSELASFLLKPYTNKRIEELYERLRTAESTEHLAELKEYIPESNWKRYFSGLVACEDSYLKKRWDELYELRCKVAHNAIIDKNDLDRIAIIAEELRVKLSDAIEKLPQVKVPAEEVQQLVANATVSLRGHAAEFITAISYVEDCLRAAAGKLGLTDVRFFRKVLPYLQEHAFLDKSDVALIRQIRSLRNDFVHGKASMFPQPYLVDMTKQANFLAGYFEQKLRNLHARPPWQSEAPPE